LGYSLGLASALPYDARTAPKSTLPLPTQLLAPLDAVGTDLRLCITVSEFSDENYNYLNADLSSVGEKNKAHEGLRTGAFLRFFVFLILDMEC